MYQSSFNDIQNLKDLNNITELRIFNNLLNKIETIYDNQINSNIEYKEAITKIETPDIIRNTEDIYKKYGADKRIVKHNLSELMETKEHLERTIAKAMETKRTIDEIFIATNRQNVRPGLEGLIKYKLNKEFSKSKPLGQKMYFSERQKEIQQKRDDEELNKIMDETVKNIFLSKNQETPLPDTSFGGKSRRRHRKKHGKTKKFIK